MQKLIGMFMILALVFTTATPTMSHAMPGKVEATKVQVAEEGHDCHGHGAAKVSSERTTKNHASENCCDKSICKCIGGTCHNGLSMALGNTSNLLISITPSKAQFSFAEENADSAFLKGLKRPPRT